MQFTSWLSSYLYLHQKPSLLTSCLIHWSILCTQPGCSFQNADQVSHSHASVLWRLLNRKPPCLVWSVLCTSPDASGPIFPLLFVFPTQWFVSEAPLSLGHWLGRLAVSFASLIPVHPPHLSSEVSVPGRPPLGFLTRSQFFLFLLLEFCISLFCYLSHFLGGDCFMSGFCC